MRVSEETMMKALTKAGLNRRAAVQLELAVGLVAILMHDKEAKPKLYDFYESAEYECRVGEADYKTVNRRINASEKLFNRLGREDVAEWVKRKREMGAIVAVARQLADMNICSIDDAIGHEDGIKRKRKPRNQERRRWTDEERENAFRISTEHVSIVIPPTITKVEMMELALKIAEIADKMNGIKKAA